MEEFVRRLDESVSTLEERFDRIHSALEEYRQFDTPQSVVTQDSSPTAAQLDGVGKGESLFDNLLHRAIGGYDLHFRSDSEDASSFTIIVDNTSDPVLLLDASGQVLVTNPAFEELFGYTSVEMQGRKILDFIPKSYHHAVRERFATVLNACRRRRLPEDNLAVFRTRRKSGEFVSVECLLASYLRDEEIEIAVILRDLAHSHEIAALLSASQEQFETLSETITEAILRIDEDFTIIFANSAVHSTFGYTREELTGTSFRMLFPPEILKRHEESFHKYFYIDDQHRSSLGMKRTLEILGRHKHRGVSPMEMSFGNSSNYRGRSLTCIIRDISSRKNTERRLRNLAYYDQLTSLGNRDLFNQELKLLFSRKDSGITPSGALLFLDLDGFKQVNDSLGHEAGDELLISAAKRLRESLRESDSIYRFGGDEFVVLLKSIATPRNAALVAQKLLEVIAHPFTLNTNTDTPEVSHVNVGVSIGIALIPDHGDTINRMTKSADLAMYHAKEAGKNCYRFFDAQMDTKVNQRLKMEQGMRLSLNNGGFNLFYQPLVDENGRIKGVEALARWYEPELGWVSPATFIPLAEETNLIIPLGNWIMETACRQLHSWHETGYRELTMSINLSVIQFSHPKIVDILSNAVLRSGVDPAAVKLEITETNVMKDPETTIAKMQALKDRFPGLKFVIDDFGTGYSSLNYLSRLPVDSIKIDLSFVSRLFEEQNQKVVNAIINLAETLELEYVAEGVENEEQSLYFSERGCRLMQGFHFFRPMKGEKIETLLAEQQVRLGD